jgi:ParB family chromosome partitioning protein
MTKPLERVEMIPIDSIVVANPRVRNPKIHKEVTDSIERVGLKRPITVRREAGRNDDLPQYALICGQGRMESCRMLGQTEIAAVIMDTDEETAHIMSIVENVARRLPRASETLEQIGTLSRRGYTDAEIAGKLGCTTSWVNNVVNLLERGEKRLLAATEAGDISMSLAVSIARSSNEEAQKLLLEAYEKGDLKGKKVTVVRQLLDQRARSGKHGNVSFEKGGPKRRMTPDDLAKLYQRHSAKHRLIQKKAEHTRKSLLIAQQIFKELFASKEFCEVLKHANLTTVPQPLAELSRRAGYMP